MSTTALRVRACSSFLLTPGSRPERFAGACTGDDIIVEFESNAGPADKCRLAARRRSLS